ncbi:MAG: hypothetical protein M1377_04030 [Deltaproteobacteria bacterium]|nr:hypothetical protein [Deltaproteobacteria bacterium]
MSIELKEAVEYGVGIFMAGGAWRELWLLRKTVNKHTSYLSNDRDVLIELTTEHNKNHGSCVKVPNANGRAA